MENENNVELDTLNESEQGTELEIVDSPVADINDDSTQEAPAIDVDVLQATNKRLFERAKKAEAELKALRPKVVAPKPVSPASPTASVEETVLLATGMPEELLTQLKKVAQVTGQSLIKAQTDEIFVAVKEKFEKEQKSKDASLGASRNSGNVKARKTFNTPGLSREEHMKMVQGSI